MSILKIAFSGPVDTGALHGELAALTLPGLGVVSRLSRETDADGKLVLGNDGRPVAVPPYVMIVSDPLTAGQVTAVEAAVAAHVPAATPTAADRIDREAQANPMWRAWVNRQAVKEGKTPAQIRAELNAQAP